MLDEAVGYIAQDSLAAAQRFLVAALDAAASLTTLSERGRRLRFTRPKFTSWRFCMEHATLRSGGARPVVSLGVADEALLAAVKLEARQPLHGLPATLTFPRPCAILGLSLRPRETAGCLSGRGFLG